MLCSRQSDVSFSLALWADEVKRLGKIVSLRVQRTTAICTDRKVHCAAAGISLKIVDLYHYTELVHSCSDA